MKKFSLLVAVLWTAMTSFAATYVPFTGTLTEGDYLITYGQYAMGNTITKNRMDCVDFTQSEFVADPDEKMVWHIAFVEGKDNVVTLYNAAAGKYAAGNGTKNQIKLVDEVSDDFAQWTLTATDGGFEFVNVGNQAKGVNSNLRNNSTYGFACYSAQTGGVLALYAEGAYTAPQTRTLTFDAGVWNEAGAVFAAWVWGDGMTAQWTGVFTATEKQNIYTAEIPYEATGMIFFRLPAETAVVAGTEDYNTYAGSKWNQTGDETILLTDPYFTITGWEAGTWGTPVVYSTCADVNAVSANTEMTLGEVTVVFAKGSNIYVQDATGITLVYNNNYSTLKAGDRVSGIAGTAKLYNGLPELAATTAADQLVVTEGTAPVIPDATAAITAADVNKVFMLRHMQMPQGAAFTTSATNIAVTFYGTEIQLRNNWKEAFTFDENREYTMLGCVAIYNGTVQVYVTDFEVEYADDETLPFTFDANIWSTDDLPLFAAWTWAEGGEGQWTNFFKHVDGTVYQGEMPAKHNNLIFVRVNPEAANATMSWDYVYNQTGNLTFNAEDPYFTITGWGEGENPRSTGVWGTPEPAPTVVTVEEALKIIAALEDKQITDEKYTVTGYVAAITSAYSEKYGDITFTLGNSADATDLITVYQAIAEDAEVAKALAAGDKVTVTGNLQKYGTTPEFAKGASFVLVEKAPAPQVEAGIYLAGSMTSWAENMIKLVPGTEDQLYTTTVALNANAAEEFKIVVVGEEGSMTWYGLQKEGTVTETVTGWWLYTTAQEGGDAKNIGLKTAGKGEYTFIYKDNENHELSVTYPEVTPVTPVDAIYYETFGDGVTANTTWASATTFTDSRTAEIAVSTWKVSKSTTSPCDVEGSSEGSHMFSGSANATAVFTFGDLRNYKNVKFSFNWKNEAGKGKARTLGFYYSTDGGETWSDNQIDVENITDQSWYAFRMDVTAEMAANFAVKFETLAANASRVDDIMLYEDEQGGETPQPEMYTFYIETSKMMGEGANNFAAWTWKEGGVDAAFSSFFRHLDAATMEVIGKQMGAPEGTDFSKYTVYAATVPAGMDSVIIVRFDEPVNEPAWTVSAAQTVDLQMIYSDMPFLVITGFDEEVKKFNAVWGLPEDVDDPVYSIKAQQSADANDWGWYDFQKDDETGLYVVTFEYFGGTGIDFGTRESASFITFEVLGLTEAPVAGDIIRIIFDGQQSLRANFIQHQTPETVFYIKAQMSDNGDDWAWNAMQKNDDEVYTLDLTYFGGIGVNFSADKQEGDETLVTFEALGIEPVAGDVIRFTVNEAGALVAENLGHVEPCEGQFGILLNGDFMQAVRNEAAANEYMLIGVELAENDKFTLYDNCNQAAWTVALDDASVAGIVLENDEYVVNAAGTYDLYIKLIQDNDQLYIGKHEVVETKYYIKAQMSENANDWAWTEMQKNDDEVYTLDLKYFGGTGVNFSTEQKEGDESLITFETLGIEPVVYDVIRYTVSETGTLAAEIIGHDAPCVNEFGIMFNNEFLQGELNPANAQEYMLLGMKFAENDEFTLYNNCAQEGWVVALDEASTAGIVIENEKYVVKAAGTYDLYIKIFDGQSGLYIEKQNDKCEEYGLILNGVKQYLDYADVKVYEDKQGELVVNVKIFQLDYTFSVGDAFTLFSECSDEINAALANIDLSKIDGIEYDAATKTYKVTKAGAYSIFIKMNDEDIAEVTIDEDKSATAIDNAQVEMMDGKFVRDGQLFIIREGVIYNAQGAVIRK